MTYTETASETATLTHTPEDTVTPTLTATQCPLGILGNSQIGTNSAPSGGYLYASRFELLQPATITKTRLYIGATGSGMMISAVYSDQGGKPDSLLALSIPKDIYVNSGWNDMELSVSLPAGNYWLAFQTGIGVNLRYNPTGSAVNITNPLGLMPDPFGMTGAPDARSWSIYAEFCPDAGYLVTATVTPTITETATVTPYLSPTVTATQTPPGPPNPEQGDSYVYPMPASDSMTLVYGLSENAEITVHVFDFAGNLVREYKGSGVNSPVNSLPMDVSRLRSGIYYYMIKAKTASGAEQKFKINKFIVRR